MVDLTTLEGADTPGKVRALAAKGAGRTPINPDTPQVAALCIYPDMVAIAVAALAGTGDRGRLGGDGIPDRPHLAGGPAGGHRVAVEAGATEVDMVIDRGAFLAGRYGKVFDEIVAVKQECGAPGSR